MEHFSLLIYVGFICGHGIYNGEDYFLEDFLVYHKYKHFSFKTRQIDFLFYFIFIY